MMDSEQIKRGFGQRFLTNLVRWYVWVVLLGTGYHTGQLAVIATHGLLARGLVIFATGVAGYIMIGIAPAAIIACLASALPRLRILPTSLKMGALRAFLVGILLGILSVYYQPSLYLSPVAAADNAIPCTDAAVEAQFQKVMSILNGYEKSAVQPKTLVNKMDAVWAAEPACTDSSPSLSQEEGAKYLDILLIGNAISVAIYFDAGQYKKARKHLDDYLAFVKVTEPVAETKGWKGWLSFAQQFAPLMKHFDEALSKAGYPPKPK